MRTPSTQVVVVSTADTPTRWHAVWQTGRHTGHGSVPKIPVAVEVARVPVRDSFDDRVRVPPVAGEYDLFTVLGVSFYRVAGRTSVIRERDVLCHAPWSSSGNGGAGQPEARAMDEPDAGKGRQGMKDDDSYIN